MQELNRKLANEIASSRFIKGALSFFEPKGIDLQGWEEARPVFVIGPPRSGTTLLYQLVTANFSFAYINRLMNLFNYCPLFMGKISHFLRPIHLQSTSLRNDYGTVPGIFSPDQGEKIWRRLLPEMKDSDYIPSGSCSNEQILEIRRLILGLQRIFNLPFLNKSSCRSHDLAVLDEAFPGALFIALFRDPIYNAQSLHRARIEKKVNRDGWWGDRPKEYSKIRYFDSIGQSVRQVYYNLKQIDEDRCWLCERILWLKYETLCERPKMTLGLISKFLEERGLNMRSNRGFTIPAISDCNTKKVDGREFRKIKCEVDEVFGLWEPEINERM